MKEKDNQELMVFCGLMKKNSFKEEGFMVSVSCCGLVRYDETKSCPLATATWRSWVTLTRIVLVECAHEGLIEVG